jgi:NAD(P)-dependent dehydrogenase (short-subunit alcohol dehydrogenase family)
VREISMSGERKVAVVTRASRGIGAVLVKAYRDRNYRVVATARSIGAVDDDEALAVPGDDIDRKTAEHAIQHGVSQFGRIDALVNNAGIFIAKPLTSYTEADYAAIRGVNIAGFFHMSLRAAARMEKQGRGHIVHVTTSLVEHAIAGAPSALGSLTKGSLNAPTKSLAIEFARRNICVNANLAMWRV